MPQAVPVVLKIGGFIGALGTKAGWIAIGKFALTATLVSAASYAIGKALAPKMKSLTTTGPLELTRNPLAARRIIYGERRVGGEIRFSHATGGENNDFLHLVIVWAGHQCQAIPKIYFGTDQVTLDGAGNATGIFAGVARIRHHLGAWNQAADTTLIAECPGYWTANDRLRGCCYSYIRLKNDPAKFPGGLPLITAVVRGRLLYDPRDEDQDAENPTTWSYSPNAALCTYDYARGVPMLNGAGELVRIYGGRLADEDIVTESVIASANVCDELIGTERRYEIHGAIDADAIPAVGLEAMAVAMAGKCYDVAGQLVIRAGAWEEPDVLLDVNALRGPVGWKAPLSWREKANIGRGTFSNPAELWNQVEFPPVVSDTLVANDNAELPLELDLGLVTSSAQCQRIAKLQMLRTRQGIVAQLPCNLRAIEALTGENFRFTFEPMGWDEKSFELLEFGLSIEHDNNRRPLFVTDLVGQETDASIYDWTTDEENPLDPAPNSNLPDPRVVQSPTNVTLTSRSETVLLQQDGTAVPRLLVEWDAPADQAVHAAGRIVVEYRPTGGALWSEAAQVLGNQTHAYITDVQIGTAYEVRLHARNNLGVPSAFVAAGPHTVTGDTDGPDAISDLVGEAFPGYIRLYYTRTTPDTEEFLIYRGSSTSFGSATLIGKTRDLVFDDPSVVADTLYRYWVVGQDSSENVSSQSNREDVTAVAGPLGDVTPNNPTAASKTSESTYVSGDGTVFAQIRLSVPALPSGAVRQNLLYRRHGSSGDYMIGAQLRHTSTQTVWLEDLSPGVAYDVATQAWSASKASSVVAATGAPFTAPNKATGPSSPTGLATSNSFGTHGYPAPRYFPTNGELLFASWLLWDQPAELDVASIEVVTGILINAPSNADPIGTGVVVPARDGKLALYMLSTFAFNWWAWARFIDRSGGRSDWTSAVSVTSNMGVNYAGNLGAQDADDVAVTGLKVGTGSAPQNKVLRPYDTVSTLTGGTPTESKTISLSGMGFSAAPDWGQVNVASDADIIARYAWDASSASSATVVFSMKGGGNLPAGPVRWSALLGEY